MSIEEHAIENAIFSFYYNGEWSLDKWKETDPNLKYLSERDIDLIETMAIYIRYTLCWDREDYLRLLHREEWNTESNDN